MKVLVINGSPKGDYSVTLQTVKYIEHFYPQCEFEVLNVGKRIKAIEKDFSSAEESLKNADILLFSYPVYTFIAPYQLHRFIEILKEKNISLEGKFATQLSTSKHFYDVTAHRYIQDNCCDLGLKYIKGLSADMDDLTLEKGQKQAIDFFKYVLWCVENDRYEKPSVTVTPKKAVKVTVPEEDNGEKQGDIVILTNCEKEDAQLQSMIDRFSVALKRKTRIINIGEYAFSGGCLGCFHCSSTGKCIYKDGFDEFLRNEIQKTQAIVYAFSIKDHSMGASFKLYDDRQFCNGHRTVTMGMPVGYLISGNYNEEFNLQMIVEGRAQVGTNFLAGVATDEVNPDSEIDALAEALEFALENAYVPPQNFYGIGGMKIFRDLIWLMQGMMRADHKFFKAHGQYDFPQKKRGTMLAMYAIGSLMSSPKLMKKAGNMVNEGMIMPYKKVLDNLEKDKK